MRADDDEGHHPALAHDDHHQVHDGFDASRTGSRNRFEAEAPRHRGSPLRAGESASASASSPRQP
jgi:hypothetical protein